MSESTATTYARRSPVHHSLAKLNPEWVEIQAMQAAQHIGGPDAERRSLDAVAICDVSALRKFSIKGPEAEQWLSGQSIELPADVYGWNRLSERGGKVMRVSRDEFYLEDGLVGGAIPELKERFSRERIAAYPVERQDAGILLCGPKAKGVMAQTCGIEFHAQPERLVYTRIATASAAILYRNIGGLPVFRIWCKASYAIYLWDTLYAIVCDAGGAAVGVGCVEGLL